MANRAERRNDNYAFHGKTARSLEGEVRFNRSLVICTLCLTLMAAVCSLISMIMLATSAGVSSSTADTGWIECTLENNIGYSVKSDWQTDGYGTAVMFYPSDTTIISVGCDSVLSLNADDTIDIKCTYDTLSEYVKKMLLTSYESQSITAKFESETKVSVLDTEAIQFNITQTQTSDQGTASTYSIVTCFLYKDYLYTLSFTSGAKGYPATEYTKVVDSLRVIPDEELSHLDVGNSYDDTLISDYNALGSTVTTTVTTADTSNTLPDVIASGE